MDALTTGLLPTTIVLGIVITLFVIGVYVTGQGPTLRDRLLTSQFFSPMLIIHYFLPYSLIILVIFVDIMSQIPQAIFSLLPAFGLVTINKMFGGTPAVPSELCEIPGMQFLASTLMPQSILFISTIVF